MIKKCVICGQQFHAQRSSAKYCSTRCRVQAHRGVVPMHPDDPPVIVERTNDVVEDAALLVNEAHQLSSAFIQQSNAVPLPLRAGCERIGTSLHASLEREGW